MTVIKWFGPQTPKKKPRSKRPAVLVPEAEVQRQVLTLLKYRNIYAWRNNKGSDLVVASSKGHKRRFIRYGGPDGAADVFALLPPNGQFLAIECKSARGVVSDDQVAFGQLVEDAGGVWMVVRDVKDLVDWLDARSRRSSPWEALERIGKMRCICGGVDCIRCYSCIARTALEGGKRE